MSHLSMAHFRGQTPKPPLRVRPLKPQSQIEVDDGGGAGARGVDRFEASSDEQALDIEDFEETDGAIVVAQACELGGARERALARELRRERFARIRLRGDVVAHVAEGDGDRLLVELPKLARARLG